MRSIPHMMHHSPAFLGVMGDSTYTVVKDNRKYYRLFCTGLFLWFSSLTLIQIWLAQYNLSPIIAYAMLFAPTGMLLIGLLFLYSKLSKNITMHSSLMPEEPNIVLHIFIIYLFWGGVSVAFAMYETKHYIIGCGYLLGYLLTLITLYIVAKLNKLSYGDNIFVTNHQDIVCYIGFLSSAFLMVCILLGSIYEGSLFSESRMLVNLRPATVGLISLPVFVYPLVYRMTVIRFILLIIATLLVVQGGSRTAFLSIFATTVIILFVKKPKYLIILSGLTVLTALIYPDKLTLINEKILYLDDYYRGVSTLSGRWDIWAEFWNIFQKNPLVGHGFRMSEMLFDSVEMASAHNAYIGSLVETGMVGTALLITAVMLSMIRLAKYAIKYQDNSSYFYFFLLFASLIFGIGERFIINIGNVTSILCMFTFLIKKDAFLHPQFPPKS